MWSLSSKIIFVSKSLLTGNMPLLVVPFYKTRIKVTHLTVIEPFNNDYKEGG